MAYVCAFVCLFVSAFIEEKEEYQAVIKMAPATNWLSFSLSPLEMLRSSESTQFMAFETPPSSSSDASPQYLIDNFYANNGTI